MKTKFLYLLYVLLVLGVPLGAVTVQLPGGGVDLAAALTWVGKQVFTNMDATGIVSLGGSHASTEAGVEVEKTFRVSGSANGPTTGVGVEMAYIAPDAYIIMYNRDTAGYGSLIINAAPLQLNPNGAIINVGGQLQLLGYASATMRTTAPAGAGYQAWNTTANKVCIGTGTGGGAWVLPSDGTTACD
jgi:hypothetical protein